MTPHIIDGKAMTKANEVSLKEMIKALELKPKLIIVTAESDILSIETMLVNFVVTFTQKRFHSHSHILLYLAK